jgi:sortilin (neurotensin receptor 3)/BNR-Asp box repeat protein
MPLTLSVVFMAALTASQLTNDLAWRNIGPAITGGRIDDIAVDEAHPDTIYIGAATGGVWKTVNGGTTWTPIFDDFGTTSIGAVAVSRSNPNIVWVGTGEANNRQSSSWGNGVYRSTDGGATWQSAGLADTKHIGRIVIHPTNPDIVYVAALGHLFGPNRERGLFKTTDGGRTWTNTKYIDENTGFADVAMDPRDPNVLYAAAYQRQRRAHGFNGGGPGSGLYRTTDGAKTWTRVEGGLPGGNVGRIAIAIARSNSNIVYVTYEHKNGGVFRSEDRGKTWTKINALQPRPLYFSQIRIDPKDDRRVYVLGTSLFVSDDGGRTFRSDGARNVHVDHHAMWIDPNNPSVIWLGNDGGVWVSRDRSVTWTRINNMPLAQIYGVGFDNRDPYYVYAGLQDNGVWSGPSATRMRVGPMNDDWIQVGGGDGMMVTASTNDVSTAYVEMQDGRVLRFNPLTGESKAIRPFVRPPARAESDAQSGGGAGGGAGESNPNLRFNWTTPIVVSSHNPQTVYIAGHRLWRSLDRGEHWTAVSPDLTRHLDRDTLSIMGVMPGEEMLGRNDGIAAYGTATAFAESAARAGLLAAGTDDGLVQISKDGGGTWDNATPRIPNAPDGAWVSGIEWSPATADRLYVAFDNHRNDDYQPYLYVSDDAGTTWRTLIAGLRADAPVRSIREDPRNPNLLFAGTENGLMWSFDRGAHWDPLKNALPDVPVFDIQIHPRDRELVIATHGRGIYVMNIARLEQIRQSTLTETAHLFEPAAITIFNFLEHRDFLAQSTYVGGNPPRAAGIEYILGDGVNHAALRITSANGDVVREIEAPRAAGAHRVDWDLRLAPPPQPTRQPPAEGIVAGDPRPAESTHARIAGDFGGGGDPTGGEAGSPPEPLRGPVVPPGTYRVTLVADGVESTATLGALGDPRVQASDDELRARWQTQLKIYDAQRIAIPIANQAIELRDKTAAVGKALAAVKISDDLKTFVDETTKIVRQAQGRIARVTQQLGSVARDVAESTSRPTEAQDQQLAAALEDLSPAIARVNDLVATRIPELNRRLDAATLPASVPRVVTGR